MEATGLRVACVAALALAGCVVAAGGAVVSAESDDAHATLRNDTATACFVPDSHLRLARYHYEHGHGVQAVYLAEYARRLFGDQVFLSFFNDLAAVRLTEPMRFKDESDRAAFCSAHPDSAEAYARDLEGILQRSDLRVENAEELLSLAFAKYPRHASLKALAAAYYAKRIKDLDKALPFYVDLYFHNPRFDDGMGVAERIGGIGSSMRKTWWESRKRSGLPLERLVSEEQNPEVLEAFVAEACAAWRPALAKPIQALLEKDDPVLQTRALAVMVLHPGDVPLAATAKAMLGGNDLVKRALAAFVVVNGLGPKQYALLDPSLDSGVELVQANAVQALSEMGGDEGRAYLRLHPPKNAGFHVGRMWQTAVDRSAAAATNAVPKVRWGP